MARPNKKGLSSADPSSETLSVRVSGELANAVHAFCEQQGIQVGEFLRSAIESGIFGKQGLSGPDLGYQSARSMAAQIAHAVLSDALGKLPETHEEMVAMLQSYYASLADKRRR